eukprot:Rhum_TRINITY_DN12877_c0_g2::Rhum_TRINITY_DN12877_c0_g2_i1::g.55033::m.55033
MWYDAKSCWENAPRRKEAGMRETAAEPDWWFARLSVSPSAAKTLLYQSGCQGVFVTSEKPAGGHKICWLREGATPRGNPAQDHLGAAKSAATKFKGRVLANARGLDIVVPAEKAREAYEETLGDDVGLRGCPTFRVDVPRK